MYFKVWGFFFKDLVVKDGFFLKEFFDFLENLVYLYDNRIFGLFVWFFKDLLLFIM